MSAVDPAGVGSLPPPVNNIPIPSTATPPLHQASAAAEILTPLLPQSEVAQAPVANLTRSDFAEIQRQIWIALRNRQEEAGLTNVRIMADVHASVGQNVLEYYGRLRLERMARGLGSAGLDGYVGDKLALFKKQVSKQL